MKKTNKKFIVIFTAVALLTAGGVMISNLNTETVASKTIQILEPTVGHIDISTTPYTQNAKFIIYEENELDAIEEAAWLQKFNFRGYVLQKEGNNRQFTIKANEDGDIKLVLRGPDQRDSNNQMIEYWVDFTSVTVNGEEILDENVAVWHNKPFYYTINAKAGETYNVVAKWQKHEESAE